MDLRVRSRCGPCYHGPQRGWDARTVVRHRSICLHLLAHARRDVAGRLRPQVCHAGMLHFLHGWLVRRRLRRAPTCGRRHCAEGGVVRLVDRARGLVVAIPAHGHRQHLSGGRARRGTDARHERRHRYQRSLCRGARGDDLRLEVAVARRDGGDGGALRPERGAREGGPVSPVGRRVPAEHDVRHSRGLGRKPLLAGALHKVGRDAHVGPPPVPPGLAVHGAHPRR
mmetsp:Transcript_15311/g.43416  ORF Transcript_15311/g.43416 Transcript_15311/m.43416 type:complete len:226 (-) Transcript_15311:847-1524(-)